MTVQIAQPRVQSGSTAPREMPEISQPSVDLRRLEWDTDFFGATMGEITLAPLGASGRADVGAESLDIELRALLTQAAGEGYRHLIFRIPADRHPVIWAAERADFRLVDVGIDSTFSLRSAATSEAPPMLPVRAARTDDLPRLQEIAGDAFAHSRFTADPFFSDEQTRAFYERWIANLAGGLAQAVLVCDLAGEVAGFVSCALKAEEGRIPLIATAATRRHHGIGRGLVSAALQWFAGAGAQVVRVKTQASNYAALALYHRAGFTVSSAELTFSITPASMARA